MRAKVNACGSELAKFSDQLPAVLHVSIVRFVSAEETHILHDEAYLPLTRGFTETTSLLQVLEAAAPSQLRRSRENYFRFTELFLGKSLGERLLIDKNPALNVLIPAVARIFPEAKFLVALRDPRDVCLSCFMQSFVPVSNTNSAYLRLDTTVEEYINLMEMYRDVTSQMSNPSLVVRYEDVVENLEGEPVIFPGCARRGAQTGCIRTQ